MRPRADEIVHSIAWTFDSYIAPDLTDPFAKSLALSISYLLRHVEQRIRHEGPALYADNQEIRGVLSSVQALLHNTPVVLSQAPFVDLSREIETALTRNARSPDEYPTLESLTNEATELRWALVHAIDALDKNKPLFAPSDYQKVRDRIRTYLRHQLEREATHVQALSLEGLDPLAGRV